MKKAGVEEMAEEDRAKILALFKEGRSRDHIYRRFRFTREAVRSVIGKGRYFNDPGSPPPSEVVRYSDGGCLSVSHGISAESAKAMVEAMSEGREIVSWETVA